MKLTNFLNPKANINLLSTTAIATYGALLYFGNTYITKGILSYLLIDYFFEQYSKTIALDIKKCDIEHPLYKTVYSLIYSNEYFKNIDYVDVFITNSDEKNALALPKNRSIYVNRGLIEEYNSDYSNNELKALISHELGHISSRNHYIILKPIMNFFGFIEKILVPYILDIKSPTIKNYMFNFTKLIKSPSSFISRQFEYDADQYAVDSDLGIDLIFALEKIDCLNRTDIVGAKGYIIETICDHPLLYNRAAAIYASLMERQTEYDNWYNYIKDSISHTFSRLVDQHLIHFDAFNRVGILGEELKQYQMDHI